MARFAVGAENGLPIELHYTDYGEGQPVVLLHGWATSSSAWEAQVPALVGAGYRVIAYDRRGFGQSSQPWHGYEYDTFVADLAALLDHLDLSDAILIGFSMGGGEVVRYLARFGSRRVAGAVLAAAVPPYLLKSADNPDGGLDDATIARFEEGVRTDRPAFLDGFTAEFFNAGGKGLLDRKSGAVSEPMRQYALRLAEVASPKATLDCIAAFARTDFRADLAAVTVPTLVLHGDSDAVVPFEVSAKRSHEAIAGSELVVIEGGPHGINASHAEQFNATLLDFLARL
jgi:non-heme chloroperoxidase